MVDFVDARLWEYVHWLLGFFKEKFYSEAKKKTLCILHKIGANKRTILENCGGRPFLEHCYLVAGLPGCVNKMLCKLCACHT